MKNAFLGLVQGVTEFLPISSSGHLVVSQYFFGIKSPGVTLEVFLHLATLFAVILFFRRDILSLFNFKADEWGDIPLILLIFIASLPAFLFGVLLKGEIESFFETIEYVKYFFLLNGIILFTTFFSKEKRDSISVREAILIGFGQAFALLPGISRSGTTITIALLVGIKREKAFRFSFLLSIPAILGASLFEGIKGNSLTIGGGEIFGFLTALASGLIALWVLRKIVIRGKFYLFGLYTVLIGCILFILKS